MEVNDTDLPPKEEEQHNASKEGITKSILLLTFLSALGGFLFGYDTGVISGAMLLMREEFQLTTLWQEMIVAITVVSAWAAALIGGPVADFCGRKKLIMGASLIFLVGSILLACAQNEETILIGRAVVGFGIGFASMCVPIYISELAEPSTRGRLTVVNTIFLTGGQFVASLICGIFSEVYEGWRYMLGLGAVPALVQFIGFIFSPESPRWLVLHNRCPEAESILRKFRNPEADIENELEILKTNVSKAPTIRAILASDTVRRALILGCLLQLCQQIAGINTVMYYSASIIAMAGVNNHTTAIWLSAATSFFNFSFTFVGLWLVERVGRRPLTLGSLLGVTGALLSLALSFQLAYVSSPSTTYNSTDGQCSNYSECSSCTYERHCGFCFVGSNDDIFNSTCLPSNNTEYNQISTEGMCTNPEENDAIFAYNWCPSKYSWLSVVGLCLYLCFFAPGMGAMPWSINSEIYPGWARARCTSIATSVNWAANLFVSLTFLSLMEMTKQGTFYLYTCFALSGFVIFFFILPETKGSKLEEVEKIFSKPLCSLKPWKKKTPELIPGEQSYGTL